MKPIRNVAASVALLLAVLGPAIAAEGDRSGKTFMWKAERNGTTVYLLGSVHALKEDAYPLPPVIDTAFDAAKVVVFEMDLGEMSAAAVKMMVAGSLEEGRTLEEVVGPETWAKFSTRVREWGYQPEAFQRIEPWMAALTLTAFELTKHGYLAAAGLDSHLSERARQAGKELRALETAEFQVGLFAGLTPEESLAFLNYTLADLEVIIPEMEQLYLDWRAGRVEPVEEMLLEGFEEFPEVFRRMVLERNQSWLPQVEELLAGDRDAMVVVGSMHLVGDVGLVNLLRERGYTIEQQ